jgi:hypothetical protein
MNCGCGKGPAAGRLLELGFLVRGHILCLDFYHQLILVGTEDILTKIPNESGQLSVVCLQQPLL